MLDVNEIRIDFNLYSNRLEQRGIDNSNSILKEILNLDDQRRSNKTELDDILKKINILSDQVGQLFRNNKNTEANKLKLEVLELKEQSKALSSNLNDCITKLDSLLRDLPNLANETVPSEADGNQIINQSDIPKYQDNLYAHWDLVKKFNLIDFELGNKITGAGFPVYLGKLAKLQRSLINFFLDSAIKEGYKEIQVPLLVNEASAFGTGQLPDKEGLMYSVSSETGKNTSFYLIPTAEVPITNIFRDRILNQDELPIKYVGYTPCFRKEAGSWGSHVRGLNRLHQFDKVEIVQIQTPQLSYESLESMCVYIEGLLKKLELPFRRLKLSIDDLGFSSAITYDFEVYSPGQDQWLEVSSVTNFETFQANRMKLRYRDFNNKKLKPHTLNGSALALPRIVAALLENNQSKEGIRIPEVLVPYTGFNIIN